MAFKDIAKGGLLLFWVVVIILLGLFATFAIYWLKVKGAQKIVSNSQDDS